MLGLARSGRAAAGALARRGVEVVAADRSPDADPGRLADEGVEVRLGTEEESLLQGVELVVKSPGVPAESPLAAAARARGLPVWSEVELGYRLLPGNLFVGVTGTNGKTTTTELLGRDLPRRRAARRGRRQRRPGAQRGCGAHRPGRDRRLRALELPARGRRHARVRRRRAAEPRAGPPRPARQLRGVPARRSSASSSGRAHASCRAASGSTGSSSPPTTRCPAEPLIPGAHNRENAAAATAAARAAGVDDDAIAEALRTFPGVPHRLELVRELRRRPLRQRLEGDEHRRRAPRRRCVRRAAPT